MIEVILFYLLEFNFIKILNFGGISFILFFCISFGDFWWLGFVGCYGWRLGTAWNLDGNFVVILES